MSKNPRYTKDGHQRTQQALLILIAVLVILLAIVVVIALLPHEQPDPTDPSTEATTEPTVTSGPIVIGDLTLATPEEGEFISLEPQVEFTGTADAQAAFTINGTAVTVAEDGSFTHSVALNLGKNEITLVYEGETTTYHVEHRHGLQFFSPSSNTTYGCGATVQISAAIREGASLTVMLGDKPITMKKASDQLGNNLAQGFILYTGTYKLPNTNTEDLDLGPITFSVTCDGKSEVFLSGNVICQKSAEVLVSDPSVTPNYGEYMDVGSGYIVEILTNSAETFAGSESGDKSRPTLNYLPKGTVDYGSVTDIKNGNYAVHMRYGRRVYLKQIKNYPGPKISVVDTYQGTLPDHNEIGISGWKQDSKYTILTFDVLWKAPFYFDLAPQSYAAPNLQDYNISSFTAEYVDITFCYATVFEGTVDVPLDSPLFSRAEVTQNESDCTLRLYLKEAGKFYGWDAYYNEKDQLCFRFINPAKVSQTASNPYGVDLTGVRIMIDPGHGGADGGAEHDRNNPDEASFNLELSLMLKEELESMGATVLLTRSDDASITIQERIGALKEAAPDLCLSIHQNSNDDTSVRGGWFCYFTPYSKLAADLIHKENVNAGIYTKTIMQWWKNHYLSHESVCPVVLIENGFMSNDADFADIMNESVQQKKAQAIAEGVAAYFLAIQ